MSTQFFPKLSQNYIELLKDDEYYDITIKVGEGPNAKTFRAHMNILCCRSPYLRRILENNKKNKKNDSELVHIKLPNISPEIFQVILKYIYGGILSLNGQDTSDILKVLVAADELHFQELVDHLQKYLIDNESGWMEQHFELTHRTSFRSNSLSELQHHCTDLMVKSPEKIFKSFDFTSLPEKSLVLLIKRDDLQMKEVDVWEHVLKWGLAQNPTLIADPKAWTDDDFKTMRNTLQHCLPSIRFFSFSSKEFLSKVSPYRQFLNSQLYKDLLDSYMDPDSEPNDGNIPLPRNIKADGVIDSKIVNLNIASIISRWIDKVEINNKFAYLRELYLPYKFELLLRGSRDGFTPNKFHTLCDDKPITVAFLKLKGTEEIIGGYNPSIWKSSVGWGQTKYSFIFSFNDKDKFFKDAILSNVKDANHAVHYRCSDGPYFGDDLIIFASDEFKDYSGFYCVHKYYEKKIRDSTEYSLEDYEVFQLIRK